MNDTQKIKAILFDLDQTLLDRTHSLKLFLIWQIQSLQLVLVSQQQRFIQRFLELDANGSVWKDKVYQQLIAEFEITQVSTQDLLDMYLHEFNRFCVAYVGVENTIQKIAQAGYKLGLISNGKTPFQERNFEALALSQYFSSIVISEAVGLRKPDSAIFELATQQLSVKPEQCIFVGDNEQADILGAQKAGMKTIFFNQDPHVHSKYADANLHHFSDFMAVLAKII